MKTGELLGQEPQWRSWSDQTEHLGDMFLVDRLMQVALTNGRGTYAVDKDSQNILEDGIEYLGRLETSPELETMRLSLADDQTKIVEETKKAKTVLTQVLKREVPDEDLMKETVDYLHRVFKTGLEMVWP